MSGGLFLNNGLSGVTPVSPHAYPVRDSTATLFYRGSEVPNWNGMTTSKQLERSQSFLNECEHFHDLFGAGYEYFFSNKIMDYTAAQTFEKTKTALLQSYEKLIRFIDNHATTDLCPKASMKMVNIPNKAKVFWKLMTILDDASYKHYLQRMAGKAKEEECESCDYSSVIDSFSFTKRADLVSMANDYYTRCVKLLDTAIDTNKKNGNYFNEEDPTGTVRLLISGMDDLYTIFGHILKKCAV